jgi:hypothetical protein
MSDIKKDGGPAFPIEDAMENIYSGMSLRDWFAGMALQECGIIMPAKFEGCTPQEVAAAAYIIADAMLAEREK